MVKILLVEDEAPKFAHIKLFLETVVLNLEIEIAMSVTSALDAIEANRFDLVILDMSLPTFDINDREGGGRPQGFGGLEVLRQMNLEEIEFSTVVITGYEAFSRGQGSPIEISQLELELEAEFPTFFRGILYYNSSFDEWKKDLLAVMKKLKILEGS